MWWAVVAWRVGVVVVVVGFFKMERYSLSLSLSLFYGEGEREGRRWRSIEKDSKSSRRDAPPKG